MIRHNAIRQNPASGKILIHPQVDAKLLPLRITEDESPIHHTRHAVVNRRFHQRILPRSQPSRTSHTPNLPKSCPMARGFSIICLSSCHAETIFKKCLIPCHSNLPPFIHGSCRSFHNIFVVFICFQKDVSNFDIGGENFKGSSRT